MELAYFRKDAATPQSGAHRHYDWRPDWLYCVWAEAWDIGGLSGQEEDCKEVRKRIVDVCRLQVRWRGQGSRMMGRRLKFWWSGSGDGVSDVLVMVKEEV